MRSFSRLFPLSLAPCLAMLAGCGSTDGDAAVPPADSPDAAHSDSGGADSTPGTEGGPVLDGGLTDGDGKECTEDQHCDGGFCAGGECCPTLEQVCGESCCDAAETCFANACVTPGVLCHSAADCAAGEYCEPALGPDPAGGDGGVADGGPDKVCLAPAPRAGRCLALPPECPAGETQMPDGSACITACEYHPPVQNLDAVVKWQWGAEAKEYTGFIDVWATPTVGRVYDTNCDGEINELDPPNIVFVSGNAKGTCCHCTGEATSACQTGVLRVLDGASGQEVWSLRRAEAGSIGFAGASVALGDVNDDGRVEIVALTGEGKVAILDGEGNLVAMSDKRVPDYTEATFGWGGGLAIANMDGDGQPEIAFGAAVFSFDGTALTRQFVGTGGSAGGVAHSLSTFVDLDLAPDGDLELLAGSTAYRRDGTTLWDRSTGDLPNGFPGVGDFDDDGLPEAVLVASGKVWVLEGATGATELGPLTLPTTGAGGPPTVADFDGDGAVEIGVAQKDFYIVVKPDYDQGELAVLWQTPNHDFSSSVTGSTVFDFEGDGKAEVIYNDECFLWVYDGETGHVKFATPTTSFTGTEASLVADIDGDGHAEILMVSNGADPSSSGWKCDVAPWNEPDDDPDYGRPAWEKPATGSAYRGLTAFGDSSSSWVGTRTLWNQHTYHVSNICDHRDDACDAPNVYGSIPARERPNWTVPWLNNFRQNVQDKGIFDAPDATVQLEVECTAPVVLHALMRNLGHAILPAGVEVGFYLREGASDQLLGTATSADPLFPGQVAELVLTPDASTGADKEDTFVAKILVDPVNPVFHECRDDNNESDPVKAKCSAVR